MGNFGARGERYETSLASISQHTAAIAIYFLSLLGIAAGAGRFSHFLVRKAKLDHTTQIFRFKDEWQYLLTGEVLSFKENSIPIRQIDGVLLSAVVEHGKECFLYRGIVEDWSFDNDGHLDTFRLRFTYRRSLKNDRTAALGGQSGAYVPPDDRYYEVRGDLFILRYSEVKTVNLDYFSLSEEEDDGSVGVPPADLANASPGNSNNQAD